MQLHKVMAPVRSMRRVMQNDLLLLRLLKAVLKDQWRYTHITTFTKSPQLEFYFIIFPMPFWTCRWIMPYYYFFFYFLWSSYFFLSPVPEMINKSLKWNVWLADFFLIYDLRLFSNLYLLYVAKYVVFVKLHQFCR